VTSIFCPLNSLEKSAGTVILSAEVDLSEFENKRILFLKKFRDLNPNILPAVRSSSSSDSAAGAVGVGIPELGLVVDPAASVGLLNAGLKNPPVFV
jgi:hypothetical protein